MSPTARRPRTDRIQAFFEELASKGHEPLLHRATGTVRLDLRTDDAVEHWALSFVKGDISVSRRNARADASVGMERKLFEGMVKGTVNLNAALLRGVIDVHGDLGLVFALDRLLPGPPRSRASFLERQQELVP
jgi:putative sterol carrier protein